ncbi:Lateral organ boundaries, LOB [Dillenia turbinata]|uniref:Lateral organ boundaries, LOB n=1 Tax=Dillenia turbinata TaxID=194707 RepID=A0AAN8V055_9MAGN
MSSSNSPCAACKFLRRKCTQECVFAPYFPPDEPQKFAYVHKVFGASNVAKLLNELNAAQRKDAVDSLAYEAEARLRDPVYGCVGYISILKQRLQQVQNDLDIAKKELATYIGPAAMLPILQHPGYIQPHPGNPMLPYNVSVSPMLGLHPGPSHSGKLMIRESQQQQQQIFAAAQQYSAPVAVREPHMLRSYEQQQHHHQQQQQQQHQQEILRFNSGFDQTVGMNSSGFSQMDNTSAAAAAISPSLALGSTPFENAFQIQHPQEQTVHSHPHHQLRAQLFLQQQPAQPQQQQQQPQQNPQQQRARSEEVGSIGPSI